MDRPDSVDEGDLIMGIANWVGYPRSYTPGRNRPVQYVVIHYTAGSEGPTSAENGAAYDKTRTDGTSTHVFVDSNSVVREVPDGDRAHAARYHGNEIGLQLELCGSAQTRAQWLDATSTATLRLAAKQTAEWCRAHGLPVRRLSAAETRAAYYNASGSRPKGIVGHADCTLAYPEDSGDHMDPGAEFPWDVFLGMVAEELDALNGGSMGMSDVDAAYLTPRVEALAQMLPVIRYGPEAGKEVKLVTSLTRVETKLDTLLSAVAAIGTQDPGVAALIGEMHAALDAQAAAIEAEVRDAIADLGEGGASQVRADN